jgi:asparagine synthase (glutamine-hydrolysing)
MARRTEGGLELNSPKELFYYRLFREHFPKGYEKLTVRWDPFK